MKQTTELPANRLYKSRFLPCSIRIRRNCSICTMPISEAVEQAIRECIEEDILAEFLTQNRAEAKQVSIYEYDEEKHMRQEREASWEEGWEEGRLSGIKEGEERGKLSGRRELLKELIQKKLLKKL